MHSTHFFVAGSQTGVSPGHCALVVHGPQMPVVVSQTSGAVQFAFVVHSTHFFVTGLQIGVSVGHCVLNVHSVPHWPVVGLQIGSFAGQSVLAVHSTHVFVAGLQTGVSPGHCALVVQVAVQVFVAGLHIGVSPGHCALVVQPTQVLFAGSQTGVGAAQLAFVVQPTQKPPGKRQIGVGAAQLAFDVQPGVQVPVFVSQTPLAPVHCVLSVHSTQVFVAGLQSGVAPVHAPVLSASHWTQSPFARHAGSVDVGQAADEPEPKSPLQGTHWFVVVLQTGAVGTVQSLFERQPGMQTLFGTSQMGVAPVHAV